jgi:hypothetical protein
VKLGVSEVLEAASQITDRNERIRYLQVNSSVPLHTVFQGAFDPKIKWLLPEGEPPYKPNDLVDQQHVFFSECRKMYLFIEGGNNDLKPLRREALFVQMLERLDPKDAKLLLAIKDKHIPYPGITEDVIKEAFPGLLP